MKPVCSVVIRAYNEAAHIGRLLTGISQQTIQNVQIILVDSGSTDDTVEIATRHPAVQVVKIRPEEFTFGRSLNLGVAQAEADVVVIASAHVYPVYPDWLERMVAAFDDPQVGLAYGKQRGAATTQFSEHQIFKHWFPDQSNYHQAHPFCNNANAAIRRVLWLKNAYDETLTGLEDLAWARWAHEQGHHIAYLAEAEVIHVHQERWKNIYNRYRREGMAFKQIYPQATFTLADLVRLWLVNVSNDFGAAGREGQLGRQWRNILLFRAMQFWGTYQGYNRPGALTWKLKRTFYYPQAPDQPSPPQRSVAPIQYGDHPERAAHKESSD
ncbi:MAG: glycosyltransferase family 2 protein [Chloroflexi bacterium]|nr:glycosyltransferase family 2 protein [Chloroflexota bacterium]